MSHTADSSRANSTGVPVRHICEVFHLQSITRTEQLLCGSWWRRRGGWQRCPVIWPKSGSGRGSRGCLCCGGKPWLHYNKFNPMTGVSLRGENHITNIQKCYTTASCIMLPATSSTEYWAVDCLQLPPGQDHHRFTLHWRFMSKSCFSKSALMNK